jgi:hypothetical protein
VTSSSVPRPSAPSAAESRATGSPAPSVRGVALLGGLAAVCLVVLGIGGYGLGWRWTGFQDNTQLWDVLHLLLLPVVLATLPVWYGTRERWRVEWRALLVGLAAALVVLVVGGYGLDWRWTGFRGNTLWDWLELLVLPVAVSTLPLWYETRRRWRVEWRAVAAATVAVMATLIAGGYGWHWAWTGFPGNTAWDWIELLIVPFVLPAALALYTAEREAEASVDEASPAAAAPAAPAAEVPDRSRR